MERVRFRLVGLVEWFIAAGCILAALAVGAALLPDFRNVRPIVPVIAGAARVSVVPANIRPGSVSVPELFLADGKLLQVGASASTLMLLGPQAQSGPTVVERADTGERQSQPYRYAGMEFVVVTANDNIVAIFR